MLSFGAADGVAVGTQAIASVVQTPTPTTLRLWRMGRRAHAACLGQSPSSQGYPAGMGHAAACTSTVAATLASSSAAAPMTSAAISSCSRHHPHRLLQQGAWPGAVPSRSRPRSLPLARTAGATAATAAAAAGAGTAVACAARAATSQQSLASGTDADCAARTVAVAPFAVDTAATAAAATATSAGLAAAPVSSVSPHVQEQQCTHVVLGSSSPPPLSPEMSAALRNQGDPSTSYGGHSGSCGGYGAPPARRGGGVGPDSVSLRKRRDSRARAGTRDGTGASSTASSRASQLPGCPPGSALSGAALTEAIVACGSWRELAQLMVRSAAALNRTHVAAALVVLARMQEGERGGDSSGSEADGRPGAAVGSRGGLDPTDPGFELCFDPGTDLRVDLAVPAEGRVAEVAGALGGGDGGRVGTSLGYMYGSLGELAASLADLALTQYLPYMSAREVSNVTWSLARLKPALLQPLATATAARKCASQATTPATHAAMRWWQQWRRQQSGAAAAAVPPAFSPHAAAAALRSACATRWADFDNHELATLLYGMVHLDAAALPPTDAHRPSAWLACWFAASERLVGSLGPRGLTVVLWALAQLWRQPPGLIPPPPLPPVPAAWAARLRSRLTSQLPHLYPAALVQVAWGLARLQPWLLVTAPAGSAAARREAAAAAGSHSQHGAADDGAGGSIPFSGAVTAPDGEGHYAITTSHIQPGTAAAPPPPPEAEADVSAEDLLAMLTRAAIRKTPQIDSLRDLAQLSWAVGKLQEWIWGPREAAAAGAAPAWGPPGAARVLTSRSRLALRPAARGEAVAAGGASAVGLCGRVAVGHLRQLPVTAAAAATAAKPGSNAGCNAVGTAALNQPLAPWQQLQLPDTPHGAEWSWDEGPAAGWDDVALAEPPLQPGQQQQQPAKRAELLSLMARPARPVGHPLPAPAADAAPQQPLPILSVLQPPPERQQQQVLLPRSDSAAVAMGDANGGLVLDGESSMGGGGAGGSSWEEQQRRHLPRPPARRIAAALALPPVPAPEQQAHTMVDMQQPQTPLPAHALAWQWLDPQPQEQLQQLQRQWQWQQQRQHSPPSPRQQLPASPDANPVTTVQVPAAPQLHRVLQLGRCVLRRWQELCDDGESGKSLEPSSGSSTSCQGSRTGRSTVACSYTRAGGDASGAVEGGGAPRSSGPAAGLTEQQQQQGFRGRVSQGPGQVAQPGQEAATAAPAQRPTPTDVSVASWACFRLGWEPPPDMIARWAQLALRRPSEFSPQGLANVLQLASTRRELRPLAARLAALAVEAGAADGVKRGGRARPEASPGPGPGLDRAPGSDADGAGAVQGAPAAAITAKRGLRRPARAAAAASIAVSARALTAVARARLRVRHWPAASGPAVAAAVDRLPIEQGWASCSADLPQARWTSASGDDGGKAWGGGGAGSACARHIQARDAVTCSSSELGSSGERPSGGSSSNSSCSADSSDTRNRNSSSGSDNSSSRNSDSILYASGSSGDEHGHKGMSCGDGGGSGGHFCSSGSSSSYGSGSVSGLSTRTDPDSRPKAAGKWRSNSPASSSGGSNASDIPSLGASDPWDASPASSAAWAGWRGIIGQLPPLELSQHQRKPRCDAAAEPLASAGATAARGGGRSPGTAEDVVVVVAAAARLRIRPRRLELARIHAALLRLPESYGAPAISPAAAAVTAAERSDGAAAVTSSGGGVAIPDAGAVFAGSGRSSAAGCGALQRRRPLPGVPDAKLVPLAVALARLQQRAFGFPGPTALRQALGSGGGDAAMVAALRAELVEALVVRCTALMRRQRLPMRDLAVMGWSVGVLAAAEGGGGAAAATATASADVAEAANAPQPSSAAAAATTSLCGGRTAHSAAVLGDWCTAWSRSISSYDITSAAVPELCAVLSAWAALRWRVDGRTQARLLGRLVPELPVLESFRLTALAASLGSLGWRLPPAWADWLAECRSGARPTTTATAAAAAAASATTATARATALSRANPGGEAPRGLPAAGARAAIVARHSPPAPGVATAVGSKAPVRDGQSIVVRDGAAAAAT